MTTESPHFPDDVASEAIVVVDMVESTATTNRFGWYAVGRPLFRELRDLIRTIGQARGLRCLKSTGDDYLITYGDSMSAANAAVQALQASAELFAKVAERNQKASQEKVIELRMALHFGEVDVVENDREGPNVSYTFRLEGITSTSLADAIRSMPADQFPLKNYVLASEEFVETIRERCGPWSPLMIGILKLKGFTGRREVYLVDVRTGLPPNIAS